MIGIKGIWSLHGPMKASKDHGGGSNIIVDDRDVDVIDADDGDDNVVVDGVTDDGSRGSRYDKYLVQSFIGETRILSIDKEEMEEVPIYMLLLLMMMMMMMMMLMLLLLSSCSKLLYNRYIMYILNSSVSCYLLGFIHKDKCF